MTASMQLTDQMAVEKAHDVVHSMAADLRQWMRAKASHMREEVTYAIGPCELLKIASKIYQELSDWLDGEDGIYQGLRQGGHLAYLPDLCENKSRKLAGFFRQWQANGEYASGAYCLLGGSNIKLKPLFYRQAFVAR